MNKALGIIWIGLANLCWLLSSIPGWLAFQLASRRVKRTQLALFRRIIKTNAATRFGRAHHFDALSDVKDFQTLPLSEYEDYEDFIKAIKAGETAVLTGDTVELLQPTSGSTAATKLIPYTRSLKAEFKAAVDPWIASMYLAHPSILWGRHYWSISPATPCSADASSRVRIGFADDTEYLGGIQSILARALFALPPEFSQLTDHDAFEYLTLLFLCREKNLRVISVWHPSFLTVLLKALPQHFPSIIHDIESAAISGEIKIDPELRRTLVSRLRPDVKRAQELCQLDVSTDAGRGAVWPRLRIISCWTDGISEPWLTELTRCFPQATIQGKGLTATEGIVSFPFGASGRTICAVRSHFLEFIDVTTGNARCAWELEEGQEYSVVLTSGGGLYRYRLHDTVRVTGYDHQTPYIKFVARDNIVSNLVGEKLNGKHVEESIRKIENTLGFHSRFAMLAPVEKEGNAQYVLFVQAAKEPAPDFQIVSQLMEDELSRNYHYQHARNISQLQHLKVFRIDGSQDADVVYRRHFLEQGAKSGEIKFNALSLDHTWADEFPGEFITGELLQAKTTAFGHATLQGSDLPAGGR
jgi:hypothetical protein